ncbi:gem-associated protein 2-like [Mytilus californianus]|uniref:gem-associated protein 2-like n=1 Tax=Mytilus californianus TaxID=6549 RepID=UPI002245831C|nr:gem-associated protein 2-like [Mytilus californianus]
MNGSEESDRDRLQEAALIVDDGGLDDFDLDIPPTTGNEYLRRVRREANDCPKVVVADIDTSIFTNKQTVNVRHDTRGCHPAPKGFAPDLEWQRTQIADFAEFRQSYARQKALRKKNKSLKIENVPLANDVEGWCRLCFGRLQPPGSVPHEIKENESDNCTDRQGTLPLLSIMMAMDQPAVIKVLEYHINWFEATGFSDKQGSWFYSLLVCLEKPLSPEACSTLRTLARSCSNLRASLENSDDPRLAPLNLFICIVARYFDQIDLADSGT